MRLWYAKKGRETITSKVEAPDILHNMIQHIYVLHYQRKTYKRPDKGTKMFVQDDGKSRETTFSVLLSIEEIQMLHSAWICNYSLRDFYPEIYNQGKEFLESALKFPDYKFSYSNKY